MPSEYTPSMEEIREQYWQATGDPRRESEAWGEFDRFLIAHDEQVRAAERERCAQIAEDAATNWAMTYKQFAASEIADAIRAATPAEQKEGN